MYAYPFFRIIRQFFKARSGSGCASRSVSPDTGFVFHGYFLSGCVAQAASSKLVGYELAGGDIGSVASVFR